jgi:hypothetical protein
MPTTIEFPLSTGTAQRSRTTERNPFYAQAGFGVLMLWAVILLSIGFSAHLGIQPADLTDFDQLALF